jgi:hypothetical protein
MQSYNNDKFPRAKTLKDADISSESGLRFVAISRLTAHCGCVARRLEFLIIKRPALTAAVANRSVKTKSYCMDSGAVSPAHAVKSDGNRRS